MTKPDIIEEMPMNLVEVKAMLKKIKERDEELNFRAQKTDEYLQALDTIKQKEAKELKEKLEALNINRMREQHIQKIIDIMPDSPEAVRTVSSAFNISLTGDQLKNIAAVVDEYSQKK